MFSKWKLFWLTLTLLTMTVGSVAYGQYLWAFLFAVASLALLGTGLSVIGVIRRKLNK